MGKGVSKAKKEDLEAPPGFDKNSSTSCQSQVEYEYDGDFGGKMEPPTPMPSKGKENEMNFDLVNESPGPSSANYGLIPNFVIHKILLYSDLCDIISVSLCCRLFYNIQSTSHFWKEYYDSFFINEIKKRNKVEEKKVLMNWKKMFFKRIFDSSDYYYRKKYKVVRDSIFKELNKEENQERHNAYDIGRILFLGLESVGKTSFIRRIVRNEFEEEYVSTVLDEYELHFSYETRRRQTEYLKTTFVEIGGDGNLLALYDTEMKKCSGLCICFSFDDSSSLDFVNDLCQHYAMLDRSSTGIVLLGFKSDVEDPDVREVKNESDIPDIIKTYGILHYSEVSNKKNRNVFRGIGMMLDSIIARMKLSDSRVCV